LMLVFTVVLARSAYGQPTYAISLSDWSNTIYPNLQPSYIKAFGSSLSSLAAGSSLTVCYNGYAYIYILYVPAPARVTKLLVGSNQYAFTAVLARGLYIFYGYIDTSSGYAYAKWLSIDGLSPGWVSSSGASSTTTVQVQFNTTVYYALYANNMAFSQVESRASAIQKDWQGASGGGYTAWLLFNTTGIAASYTIIEGSNTVTLSSGGTAKYMLYIAKTLPVNVTGSGLNMLYSAGAYYISGSFSTTMVYADRAILTVDVAPSTYKVQFWLGGTFIGEGFGTYTFPYFIKSTSTVATVKIYDTQNNLKQSFNVTMDTSKYYYLNFGSDYATLTVTASPSTYTIQFYSGGTLVASATGTLAYSFYKNTVATVKIYDTQNNLKQSFNVTMDTDKTYSFTYIEAQPPSQPPSTPPPPSNQSWNPTPSWAQPLGWDYVKYPLKLLDILLPRAAIATSLFIFAVFAAYMHTKSALGAAIVAVFIAPPLAILLPEARWIAFIALVFGVASVLWEFSRKYVMSR